MRVRSGDFGISFCMTAICNVTAHRLSFDMPYNHTLNVRALIYLWLNLNLSEEDDQNDVGTIKEPIQDRYIELWESKRFANKAAELYRKSRTRADQKQWNLLPLIGIRERLTHLFNLLRSTVLVVLSFLLPITGIYHFQFDSFNGLSAVYRACWKMAY